MRCQQNSLVQILQAAQVFCQLRHLLVQLEPVAADLGHIFPCLQKWSVCRLRNWRVCMCVCVCLGFRVRVYYYYYSTYSEEFCFDPFGPLPTNWQESWRAQHTKNIVC